MTNSILAAALMLLETGNRPLVGDHGRAIGPLQVHAEAVADVNRRFGTRYRLNEMMDRRKAAAVLNGYLWIYATPARLGRAVTDMDRARIWNGGPSGWRKTATLAYAAKFRRAVK